ncbi:LysR family transcriptional regulator, partial [Amorphus sp. 3PC139-8]|uniref:LysR family transcriptional regulator n=1 Tax=Amorphus sp. 3PC139-8 TaxID=2735676 RepID=UPI00345CE09F
MDFKKLEYFLAVAEELNIGRAATRLDIAQPPLSRQISALEEELGVQLFDRARSQIRLTQAGCVLRDHARQLLNRLDIALRETQRVGTGSAGRLSIGFVGSASYGALLGVIRNYRNAYPDVNLDLLILSTANLQRALVEREIDIAVARPELEDLEFRKEVLSTEPLILAIPEGSTLSEHASDLPQRSGPVSVLVHDGCWSYDRGGR